MAMLKASAAIAQMADTKLQLGGYAFKLYIFNLGKKSSNPLKKLPAREAPPQPKQTN